MKIKIILLAGPLFSFCEPRRAQNDRAMALGAFAEVIEEVDGATAAQLGEFLFVSVPLYFLRILLMLTI